MGFPRQEYRCGLPFPTQGHLPHPAIKPVPLATPALAGRFFTTEPPGKPVCIEYHHLTQSRSLGVLSASVFHILCDLGENNLSDLWFPYVNLINWVLVQCNKN